MFTVAFKICLLAHYCILLLKIAIVKENQLESAHENTKHSQILICIEHMETM